MRETDNTTKLAMLRIQLFTAAQQLRGKELEAFWEIVDDLQTTRDGLYREEKAELSRINALIARWEERIDLGSQFDYAGELREAIRHSFSIESQPQEEAPVPEENFQDKARQLVVGYFNSRADVTDDYIMTFEDTYVTWFSKALQNWKAMVSTNVPDGMYYELTHDGGKKVTYIDAYKKFQNLSIPDD